MPAIACPPCSKNVKRDFEIILSAYLKSSNETASEKRRLIAVQREELQRTRKEIQRTCGLYHQEKLDADGFSKFYAPLEER